jgi:uncharacterized membrane protein (UPF0127 family)
VGKLTITLLAADGAVVCEECVVADSFVTRLFGLIGRAGLAPGRGLLLRRTRSIHTHFMRFPIDVVFLDDTERVVRIVQRLRPWRTASAPQAASALELQAGESARLGLRVGTVLGWGKVAESAAIAPGLLR